MNPSEGVTEPESATAGSVNAPAADVGVVIPTHGRRDLLRRALDSVAGQTVQPREVVVVLDGADPTLEKELAERRHPPVRVLVVNPPRGPSHARNTGVRVLQSTNVAFLDDDDEWLPRKLELQIPLLDDHDVSYTRVYAGDPKRPSVWPRDTPGTEDPSEYLFDRRRPWSGAGLFLASTIAARTELVRAVQFDESLRQHDDWDWALRAVRAGRLGFCDQVLAIWHIDPHRRRRSREHDWRYSVEWGRSHSDLFTPRAYSGFLLVNVYTIALRAGDRGAAATLVREAREHGEPSLSQWAIFAGLTALSPNGVEHLRRLALKLPARDP